jgi:pantetheine-phosphate adenylyltransferase
MFTIEERMDLISRGIGDFPNVEVDTWNGLLAEYAMNYQDAVIIKGLRAISDFESEFQMAIINKKINPYLETLFLSASEQYTYLSSSAVKEMAKYGADLSEFVPEEIIDDVIRKSQMRR